MLADAGRRLVRLSWAERMGYGLGDAGFNFYWAIIGSYLAFFYTDVFGISAAAVATMVTVTKVVDAFTDPAMGALADRTRTRWGQFRPYLAGGAVPLMASGILALTTPNFDDQGKLVWAYATYGVLMLMYTVVNIPYSSLSGVLTALPTERTLLNSSRFFFAYLTSVIVGSATPEVVKWLGSGELFDPVGWRRTMTVYAGAATVLLMVTAFTTQERIKSETSDTGTAWLDLRSLFDCRPWLILFAVAMVFMVTMTLRGASAPYYFRYFVERTDLLGTYVGVQFGGLMTGAILSGYVARFVDKRRLLIGALLIAGLLSVALTFVPKPSVEVGPPLAIFEIFGLNLLISIALGFKAPITWAMYADVADYNEWRTGRRATAMTFSATTFSQKLGSAGGSAILLTVLSALGYSAGEMQSGASVAGIVYMQSLVPGLLAMVTAAILYGYALDAAVLQRIQQALSTRGEAR